MSGDSLITVRVAGVETNPRLAWAAGMDVALPPKAAAYLADVPHAGAVTPAEMAKRVVHTQSLRLHAAFTLAPPTSTRLPFSYQMVPPWGRTLIGHLIGRIQRARVAAWAAFPRWPLDLSADFLADLYSLPPPPYAGGPTPVLLSHDIDTPEGLRNAVRFFLPIEESIAARSSNYIVPLAWPIEYRLLDEILARGHEVGIHGYDHSNSTPFAADDERRRRVAAARPLVERYGVIGYRAPSLLRTPALIEDLATLYRYDSSIPTSGGLFPMPNNGCASARPFWLGRILEIPLTLPRDGSLRFLGHSPRQIAALWHRCAERISASGGIVSLLTHCEHRFSGNPPMLDAYRRFLESLAGDDRFVFTTPARVLESYLTGGPGDGG